MQWLTSISIKCNQNCKNKIKTWCLAFNVIWLRVENVPFCACNSFAYTNERKRFRYYVPENNIAPG